MALTRSIGARQDATRGTAPVEVRKGIAAQYIRPGVLPGGATPLVTGTSGMAYSVGAAGFVTSRGVADGYHLFTNDGAVTVGTTGVGSTVPAAPSTGLKRIDIMWVRHPSAGENADTTSQPVFGVSSGTAASTPVAPTIPTGALELARNEMSAGVTSTAASGNVITQTAPYTAVKGGVVPVRSLAEQEAIGLLSSNAHPILVERMDTGAILLGNSGGWTQVAGPPEVATIAFGGNGYAPMGPPLHPARVEKASGQAFLRGFAHNTNVVTFNTGVQYAMGAIPAGSRPGATLSFPILIGGPSGRGAGEITIGADGSMFWLSYTLAETAAPVGSCFWSFSGSWLAVN